MTTLLPTLVAVLVLASLTFGVVRGLGLEQASLQPWAIVRATVQLGLLSLVLAGVIGDPVWVGVFLGAMVLAASWTVRSRLGLAWRLLPFVIVVVAVAAAVPVAVALGTGAVEASPRFVLALAGIVVGNVMAVVTLSGRLLGAALVSDREEIEGWLALGAPSRVAARRSVRASASSAILPSTDQTRTTGIVTLPGAFVGAVFAGASPLEAAAFQLVVLASILAAGALAVAGVSWRFGAPRTLPTEQTPLT